MARRTVTLWHWKGWRAREYPAKRINTVIRMIRTHSPSPPEIVVFTDDPKAKYEAEALPMPAHPIRDYRWPMNCFVRLHLWKPGFCAAWSLGDSVMSLDADVIVQDDINKIFDFAEGSDFCIAGPEKRPEQYSGAVWVMRPGTNPQVWNDLSYEEVARMHTCRDAAGRPFLGSDQAWLAFKAPGARKIPYRLNTDWRDRDSRIRYHPVILQFGGRDKPWSDEVKRVAPELYNLYNSYSQGGTENGR